MVDIAYKPTSEYKSQFDTPVKKPDLFSVLALYGKRIIKQTQTQSSTTVTLYTVPVGKTFFLLSAFIFRSNESNGLSHNTLGTNQGEVILYWYLEGLAGQVSHTPATISYSIPIRFQSTEVITYNTDVAERSSAGIVGYEIETSLIPFS